MARRRRNSGRKVDGILLLEKPSGISSNEALQRAKSMYRARKAGHTGSLDRLASGLLPVCFGDATRYSSFLLNADKCYTATCRLGIRTKTGDAAGEVVATAPVPAIDAPDLERVLDRFRGEIEQIPPMFSALKHKGQRLYELAYQGIEVERKARPVHIFSLDLKSLNNEEFVVDVVCSKGTYIRTLAEDIGEVLGCGAHVASLRRTGAGPYRETDMLDFDALEAVADLGTESLDARLLPVDTALGNFPAVHLDDNVAYYLRQGQPVVVPRAPTEGLLRIYDSAGRFLGVGEVLDDGRISPRRLFNSEQE